MYNEGAARTVDVLKQLPGVAIWEWRVPEDDLFWSAEMLELYGVSEKPAFEGAFLSLVHPDDRMRVEANMAAVLEAGDRFSHEFRIVRPNGEMRFVHDRGSVERAPDGRALRIVGMNIDVTAQRSDSRRADVVEHATELLTLALEATGQGWWDYDVINDRPIWDVTTYRLFGLEPGERVSYARMVEDIVHPDDRARIDAAARTALDPNGDGHHSVEHRVRLKDGETRWVALRGRVLFRSEDGKRVAWRMIGTARDVTADRRAARDLEESQFRLAQALKVGGIGVFDFDPRTGVIHWDERLRAIWGVPADEPVTYETFKSGLVAEDVEEAENAVNASLDPSGPGIFEARYRVRNRNTGAVHWVRGRGAVFFQDGVAVRMIGTARDVTEQMAYERAIEASERSWRELANAMPQLVWRAQPDGVVDYYNEQIQNFAGAYRTESGAWRWEGLLHDEDLAPTAEAWRTAMETGEAYYCTHRVKMADGGLRWHLSRAFPMRDGEGKVVRWYGTATDIHELKQAQELRQLLVDELNHRVKNTLAIVQSIAHQTLRSGRPEEQRAALDGRLRALSEAHDILTRENWTRAKIDDLVTGARNACSAAPGRFRQSGPPLILPPKQGVSLALALHELCTNAIKYGALSGPTGFVTVEWAIDEVGGFRLEWREDEGPPVVPPDREGFGMRLLKRALAVDFGGRVEVIYRREGLVCVIEGSIDPESGRSS